MSNQDICSCTYGTFWKLENGTVTLILEQYPYFVHMVDFTMWTTRMFVSYYNFPNLCCTYGTLYKCQTLAFVPMVHFMKWNCCIWLTLYIISLISSGTYGTTLRICDLQICTYGTFWYLGDQTLIFVHMVHCMCELPGCF